jgi:hypothetical protein
MSMPMPPSASPSSSAAELLEGAHAYLGKAHAILGRCHAAATRASLRDSQQAIRAALEQHGISFEGKRLLVSLTPTLLAGAEIERLAPQGALVRAALLEVIARFLQEHRAGQLDGPMHRHFRPYARWWDLIAAERRRSEAIQLMRYDAIREDRGRWRLLETNTCCPGGVIHCARVRAAWLASPLGREATSGGALVERPVDRPDGFLRHLHELAGQVRTAGAAGPPVIAICSYRGSYQNEVASLAAEQRRLVERGELAGGELVIGDAREVECDGGVATLRGRRIDVLYNKLDPLAIDPGDPELAGWVRAAASPEVELVNSLAAMYLTETKRVLALLRDERLRSDLALDAATLAAIDELVPRSYVLPSGGGDDGGDAGVAGASAPASPADDALLAELRGNRHRYVLKADAYTRGAGVYVGQQLPPTAWAEALRATAAAHGIAQECADIPRRVALDPEAAGAPLQEYWGVDLFYFGARFAGTVSRCHTDMVFNVGNGGKESPALVVP